MESGDHSKQMAPSPSLTTVEPGASGDSLLAQNLWYRYGSAPGVIPMDKVLQQTNYAVQFSIRRLPLLADVLRRWSPMETPDVYSWQAMPYLPWYVWPADEGASSSPPPASNVRRLAKAQVISPSEHGVQEGDDLKERSSKTMPPVGRGSTDLTTEIRQRTASTSAEVRRSGVVGETIGTHTMGKGIIQRTVRGESRQGEQHQAIGSAVERRVGPSSPRRAAQRRRQGAEASAGQPVHEQPLVPKPGGPAVQERGADRLEASPLPVHPSAGTDPSINKDGIRSSTTAGTGNLRSTIMQHYPVGPAPRGVLSKVLTPRPTSSVSHAATDIPTNVPHPISPGKGKPLLLPPIKAKPPMAKAQTTTPTGNLLFPILQRKERPLGSLRQNNSNFTAEIRQSNEPKISSDKSVPHPATRQEQRGGDTPSREPITPSSIDLGTAIQQRYLESPAQCTIPLHQALSSPKAWEEGGRSARVSPPSPMISKGQQDTERQISPVAMNSNNDLGTTIVQRNLDDPLGQSLQRTASLLDLHPLPQPTMNLLMTAERGNRKGSRNTPDMPPWGGMYQDFGGKTVASTMQTTVQLTQGSRFDMPLVTAAAPNRQTSLQTKPEMTSTSPESGFSSGTQTNVSSPTAPAITSAAESEKEINVEDLTDKVLRKFLRRLAIERERRGIRRWN